MQSLSCHEFVEEHGVVHRLFFTYLTPHRAILIVLVGSMFGGSLLYFICVSVLGVSKDTSVLAAVTFFGILLGAYVEKTRK